MRTPATRTRTKLRREMPTVREARRHRSSCLSPFGIALLVLALACICLAGLAFAVWRPSTGDVGRVNVLVLGLDRRPDEGWVARSDVLMLMSVRIAEPQVALVSIPRDLYVEIPGHGAGRINTAHFWGEQEREAGGPALAMKTVSSSFRVPVDYFVRIDFSGFRAIVDAVGGIDIAVEKGIVDNAYPTEDYGTTQIEIPAGFQRMDGETALRYVRSRHTSSDFDRAERQQQVLVALADRLSSPQVWIHVPMLLRVIIDNVDTDLSPWALIQLAIGGLRVGPDSIDHLVIDQDMTQPWTTPMGGAVLLPRWEAIDPSVREMLGPK